jgi:hypothetical protein
VNLDLEVADQAKIWAGEYVDLSLLLKSAKDLFSEFHLSGNLQINGGAAYLYDM